MRKIFGIALAVLVTCAQAMSPGEELQRYIKIFQGEKSLHSDAADDLAWKGFSDVALFDLIEQRLLADADAARGNRNEKNRVARYIRALGFSGQKKYTPTLERFVRDPVYDRYAREALLDVEPYRKWNEQIADPALFNSQYNNDENRIMNMLSADDLLLKKIGAKRIYFVNKNPYLTDYLAKQLEQYYLRTDLAKEEVDAVAWMVKALGSTRQQKYFALVERVANHAPLNHVSSHARRSLERDYK